MNSLAFLLAAIFGRGALACGDGASCEILSEPEDLTALVQLDIQMHSGAQREVAAAKYSIALNSSGASGAAAAANTTAIANASLNESGALAFEVEDGQNLTADPMSGIREQIQTWYTAEKGHPYEDPQLRNKISDLIPTFLQTCLDRGYGNQEECELALGQLRRLHQSLAYVPDNLLVIATRNRLSLIYFLWAPGPPMSFDLVDLDHNGLMSWDELKFKFGPQVMGYLEVLRVPFLDANNDYNVSRAEIFSYIRSSILIRDQLGEAADGYNRDATTAYCLRRWHRIWYRPNNGSHMAWSVKVICLVGFAIFTALFIVWAECGPRRKV